MTLDQIVVLVLIAVPLAGFLVGFFLTEKGSLFSPWLNGVIGAFLGVALLSMVTLAISIYFVLGHALGWFS